MSAVPAPVAPMPMQQVSFRPWMLVCLVLMGTVFTINQLCGISSYFKAQSAQEKAEEAQQRMFR